MGLVLVSYKLTKYDHRTNLTTHDVVQFYILKFWHSFLELEARPVTHEYGLQKKKRTSVKHIRVIQQGGRNVNVTPYPHACYLVVKAVVTKETTTSPQFFWHFPEEYTKTFEHL